MTRKSKTIILIVAVLNITSVFSVSDYTDKSLPNHSYMHAPYRESYIQAKEKEMREQKHGNVQEEKNGCFFCSAYKDETCKDAVLIKSFIYHNVILNEYPYSKGHILISPKRHVPHLDDLSEEEKLELLQIISISMKVLKKALRAEGFNVGINIGRASGASIPQHLHIHVVPRYELDLNSGFFKAVCKTTLMSWDMGKLLVLLRKQFDVGSLY